MSDMVWVPCLKCDDLVKVRKDKANSKDPRYVTHGNCTIARKHFITMKKIYGLFPWEQGFEETKARRDQESLSRSVGDRGPEGLRRMFRL